MLCQSTIPSLRLLLVEFSQCRACTCVVADELLLQPKELLLGSDDILAQVQVVYLGSIVELSKLLDLLADLQVLLIESCNIVVLSRGEGTVQAITY